MGLYKTDAIVLRSIKYKEADSLLTLMTKEKGKIKGIAKGVRKQSSRLRGGVQIFTHNEMLLYEGRGLDIVTQSQCLESFSSLQESITGMMAASYWAELADALTPEGEADTVLFHLILAGFHVLTLDAADINVWGLEIKLLSLLGYSPSIKTCRSCGKDLTEENMFSFSERAGGFLCLDCKDNNCFAVGREIIQVWNQLQQIELTKMKRLKLSKHGNTMLDQIMEKIILYNLEYPLKSRSVMKKVRDLSST